MHDIDAFRQLVTAWQAVEAAIAAAREDIESVGLAEGDPFIAFEMVEEALGDLGMLLDDAQTVVEIDGVDADYDDYEDLLLAYEDEIEEFRGQVGACLPYLVFDIEEILVDMPPLNKERLDDDDAILYSALELGEMTEPWRNVMRLAESLIQLRLQHCDHCLRQLLQAMAA